MSVGVTTDTTGLTIFDVVGGTVTPRPLTFQFQMADPFFLNMSPAFGQLLGKPQAEREAAYRDAEWRRMAEEGPTQDELDHAKKFLTGSFPLRLSSSAAIGSP